MIYGKYKAINYKKQKIIKLNQSISPIYQNYIKNLSKGNNNKIDNNNMNYTNINEKENKNKRNQYIGSNSVSKTTKNSPRNIFFQYNNNYNNKYKNNNNINQYIKYETNINSPRKNFIKKVNFKAKKLNLNVNTLNMNLEINKFNNNNSSDNEELNIKDLRNRNKSVFNTTKNNNNDNSFIFPENYGKNDINKIQVNNLRNQLNKILTTKNRCYSCNKKNMNDVNNKNKNEVQNTYNFSNDNSFIYDNYTLTENNTNNKNKCILLNYSKIKKITYLNKREKKKRNELNIKLFNSLKNNFIGIKLPNKKIIKNENIENYSQKKYRNRNQKYKELRESRTQIDYNEKDSSSIIKIKRNIINTIENSNSIDSDFNKINDYSPIINKKYINKNDIKNNNEINEEYKTILNNDNKFEENLNKRNEELENKYEVLLQSYTKLKNENINLIQENKSLKQKNFITSEENTFLNNYIISIKKIVSTIINTYSQQIKNLNLLVKNFTKNTQSEKNNIITKIKNIIYNYSIDNIQTNKKIYIIMSQLLNENKILRALLIKQKPDKNFIFHEKQNFIDKECKLNFNYDFLKILNKKDDDFEKRLYSNISFNKSHKNNSVQKKIKKEKDYESDINNTSGNNYDENNRISEKKRIKYNKVKK